MSAAALAQRNTGEALELLDAAAENAGGTTV
jgi:hypothetical protein